MYPYSSPSLPLHFSLPISPPSHPCPSFLYPTLFPYPSSSFLSLSPFLLSHSVEVRQHQWFLHKLPSYLALPPDMIELQERSIDQEIVAKGRIQLNQVELSCLKYRIVIWTFIHDILVSASNIVNLVHQAAWPATIKLMSSLYPYLRKCMCV